MNYRIPSPNECVMTVSSSLAEIVAVSVGSSLVLTYAIYLTHKRSHATRFQTVRALLLLSEMARLMLTVIGSGASPFVVATLEAALVVFAFVGLFQWSQNLVISANHACNSMTFSNKYPMWAFAYTRAHQVMTTLAYTSLVFFRQIGPLSLCYIAGVLAACFLAVELCFLLLPLTITLRALNKVAAECHPEVQSVEDCDTFCRKRVEMKRAVFGVLGVLTVLVAVNTIAVTVDLKISKDAYMIIRTVTSAFITVFHILLLRHTDLAHSVARSEDKKMEQAMFLVRGFNGCGSQDNTSPRKRSKNPEPVYSYNHAHDNFDDETRPLTPSQVNSAFGAKLFSFDRLRAKKRSSVTPTYTYAHAHDNFNSVSLTHDERPSLFNLSFSTPRGSPPGVSAELPPPVPRKPRAICLTTPKQNLNRARTHPVPPRKGGSSSTPRNIIERFSAWTPRGISRRFGATTPRTSTFLQLEENSAGSFSRESTMNYTEQSEDGTLVKSYTLAHDDFKGSMIYTPKNSTSETNERKLDAPSRKESENQLEESTYDGGESSCESTVENSDESENDSFAESFDVGHIGESNDDEDFKNFEEDEENEFSLTQ